MDMCIGSTIHEDTIHAEQCHNLQLVIFSNFFLTQPASRQLAEWIDKQTNRLTTYKVTVIFSDGLHIYSLRMYRLCSYSAIRLRLI